MSFDEEQVRANLRREAESAEKSAEWLSNLGNLPGIPHVWHFRLHEAAQKARDFAIALRQAAR